MHPKIQAVSAPKVLEQNFLEARCKLLDIAAILDRMSRGDSMDVVKKDARTSRILEALKILQGDSLAKAEQIQKLFSLPYDTNWEIPAPRY